MIIDESNIKPSYFIAVLESPEESPIQLKINKGEFLANFHFMTLYNLSEGDPFLFFNKYPLVLSEKMSNLHTTGAFNPISFSVLIPFEDVQAEIDDTFSVSYLLNPTPEEENTLDALAHEYAFNLTTSQLYAKGIRLSFSNYISLIVLVCLLMGLTVIIFIFSIAYIISLSREREFTTYQVYGASKRTIGGIVACENIFIAILSSIFTILAVLTLFKVLLQVVAFGGIPYFMPAWVVISAVLVAVLFVILITLFVLRISYNKRAVDVLRID